MIDLPVLVEQIDKKADLKFDYDKWLFENIGNKEKQRAEIAADVQAFLDAGGIIQEIPFGEVVELDPVTAWVGLFEL